jgi:hypothetical protein
MRSLFLAALFASAIAPASAEGVDPLTVTCKEYVARDNIFGLHKINGAERQTISAIALGGAAVETSTKDLRVDDLSNFLVDFIDEACLQPEYADKTVYDTIKSFIVVGPAGTDLMGRFQNFLKK